MKYRTSANHAQAGNAMNEMAVSQSQAELWTLLADRRTVRFNIPPVPLWGHGLTQPVTLHLDLDAASATKCSSA